MERNETFEPKIMMVLIQDDESGQCGFKIPPNFLVSRESRVANIRTESILKALSDGIDGVIILKCKNKDAISNVTNLILENQIKIIKQLVDHIGLNSQRIIFEEIPINDEDSFNVLSKNFIDIIRSLGVNPLKKDTKFEKIFKVYNSDKYDMEDDEAIVKRMLAEVTFNSRLLLSEGTADIIIGKKIERGNILPALFRNQKELDELVLSPEYNLTRLTKTMQDKYPDKRIGAVVYPCEERALIELARRNKMDINKLVPIKVACTEKQGSRCKCELSYPGSLEIEEGTESLADMNMAQRFNFWNYQFSKCIKCYGCRDICPTSSDELNILEDEMWVSRGKIPPDLSFHLIRFYHMSDKCIGCGECEAVCPSEIPLAILHHALIQDMRRFFNYEAGFIQKPVSPFESVDDNSKTDCGGGP
jgi:coenzyme F420-reducing hydrogenase delta subunit/ferredoxin